MLVSKAKSSQSIILTKILLLFLREFLVSNCLNSLNNLFEQFEQPVQTEFAPPNNISCSYVGDVEIDAVDADECCSNSCYTAMDVEAECITVSVI